MEYCSDQPLGECCFSSDGSVLAVAYPSGVGLWDPTTLVTLGHVSFPDAPQKTKLSQLRFVGASDFLVRTIPFCHCLFSAACQVGCIPMASLLVVWDLQSLTVRWASKLAIDCLTVDSSSDKFAVTLRDITDGSWSALFHTSNVQEGAL